MKNVAKIYVGVDISKKRLDVAVHGEKKSFHVSNNEKGLEALSKKMQLKHIGQLVCEASGGYERLLVMYLRKKNVNVWLVEPSRIKAFIRSEGVYHKTDAHDAKMLAKFASQKLPKANMIQPTEESYKLTALIYRRQDLKKTLNSETNRLDQAYDDECRINIEESIVFHKKMIVKLDKLIDDFINLDSELKRKMSLAQTIPGVGKLTAEVLLGTVPELGNIEESPLSALIGVAPYIQQSGAQKGSAFTRGGRQAPRNALYMASVAAIVFNPRFKELYKKLKLKGKPSKIALVAIMRKIICALNAMFKRNESWKTA